MNRRMNMNTVAAMHPNGSIRNKANVKSRIGIDSGGNKRGSCGAFDA